MLGVGWTEMLVIGVVALIVIGPKELPAVMRKVGQFAGTVRRMGSDFQRELNKTTGLDEVRNLRNAITEPLKQTSDAIRREFNTVTSSGAVQPSGALKPADPKAESVVDEIHAAAGMTPAEPVKAAQPTLQASMKAAVTAKTAETAAKAEAAATAAAAPTPIAPSTAAPPASVSAPAAKPKRGPAKRVAKPKEAATSKVATKPKEAATAAPVEATAAPAAEAKPKPKRTRKPAAKKA